MRKPTGKSGGVETPVDDGDDAAAAFEALRRSVEKRGKDTDAQVTVIRKSVDEALERFEELAPQIEYSVDLGNLVQQIASLDGRLAKIEKLPMLALSPKVFAEAMKRMSDITGAELIKSVGEKVGDTSREYASLRVDLQSTLKSVRYRRKQNIHLAIAATAGAVIGLWLVLMLTSVLPFDAKGHIAAFIVGGSRWDAGQTLMKSEDPSSWQRLLIADETFRHNQDALQKCQQLAAKMGKEQRCVVTVAAAAK